MNLHEIVITIRPAVATDDKDSIDEALKVLESGAFEEVAEKIKTSIFTALANGIIEVDSGLNPSDFLVEIQD